MECMNSSCTNLVSEERQDIGYETCSDECNDIVCEAIIREQEEEALSIMADRHVIHTEPISINEIPDYIKDGIIKDGDEFITIKPSSITELNTISIGPTIRYINDVPVNFGTKIECMEPVWKLRKI